MSKLLDTGREAGLPRFFILHTDPDPGFSRDDPDFRLMSFMQKSNDEPLLVKNTRNSFTTTDLQTFPIKNRNRGREMSTAEIIERTDFVLRERFARIVSAIDIVNEVKGAVPSTR